MEKYAISYAKFAEVYILRMLHMYVLPILLMDRWLLTYTRHCPSWQVPRSPSDRPLNRESRWARSPRSSPATSTSMAACRASCSHTPLLVLPLLGTHIQRNAAGNEPAVRPGLRLRPVSTLPVGLYPSPSHSRSDRDWHFRWSLLGPGPGAGLLGRVNLIDRPATRRLRGGGLGPGPSDSTNQSRMLTWTKLEREHLSNREQSRALRFLMVACSVRAGLPVFRG